MAEQYASLVGSGAVVLRVAYAPERGACAEASGVEGGSCAWVNAASVGACVVTFGLLEEEGDKAEFGLLDTCPTGRAEAGREEGQSQDPVEGSLRWGSGLVVHWGVLGRTGAHHQGVKAEVGPSLLGGWRWELKESIGGEIWCSLQKFETEATGSSMSNTQTHLEASAALPVVEARAVMSSSGGCQGRGHPPPEACCKVQLDWAHPTQSWDCCS